MFEKRYEQMYKSMTAEAFVKEGRYIYARLERFKNVFMTPIGIILAFNLFSSFVAFALLQDMWPFLVMVLCAVGYALMINNKLSGVLIVLMCFLKYRSGYQGTDYLVISRLTALTASVVDAFFIMHLNSLYIYLDTARKICIQKDKEQLEIELKF